MSGGTRWHLPAVSVRANEARVADEVLRSVTAQLSSNQAVITIPQNPTRTMVTACGKRGPIRRREDMGVQPLPLGFTGVAPEMAPLECDECMVAWDYAEERGALLTLYVSDYHDSWRGPGAVLFSVQPSRQPCVRCRASSGREYVPLAVIPRAV